MKFFVFLIFTSCHNGNTNVSTGNNTIIYDFPVTQTVKSEKIDMEILGINDLMIIDTLLFAYKASGYNDFFEIYSTNLLSNKVKGFSLCGQLILLIGGNDLSEMKDEEKKLCSNIQDINLKELKPEQDMFVLLCTLKNNIE